ncbi:MAG: FAD:protein FMN transferase [Verrucomicrobiales bacterium]|nr:FAD:protein FMN transferase [Verrucomicrobiales bacterium]
MIRSKDGLTELTFHAMGTSCRVSLVEPDRRTANAYLDAVLNWVADFEAKYSRFLETSLIARINAAAGGEWVDIDEQTSGLLDLCGQLHFLSRGAFDATALPLLRLWDWKTRPAQVPAESVITEARGRVGWHKVERRPGQVRLPMPGMCLDLGGIGKEYAVDAAIELAATHGVRQVMVDFGQDIRTAGHPPGRPAWHIGLENPRNPGQCWASVAAMDMAVATSGDYLRHTVIDGRRYGHIVDPRTGYPVDNGCLCVTVMAPTCALAGAMTTAAFILGPEIGLPLIQCQYGVSGALITQRETLFTPQFHAYVVHIH